MGVVGVLGAVLPHPSFAATNRWTRSHLGEFSGGQVSRGCCLGLGAGLRGPCPNPKEASPGLGVGAGSGRGGHIRHRSSPALAPVEPHQHVSHHVLH